jgi:pyruvate/2-oxoglutarate dehydrogenase complex dihydrolipoamide dehydrogenase (E3) component
LVYQKAEEMHKKVEVKAYLVNGALDILMKEHNVEKHNQLVKKAIEDAEKECDVVVLAQGSMTAILPCLGNTEKPVLTSPRLAVEKVKEMLEMEN